MVSLLKMKFCLNKIFFLLNIILCFFLIIFQKINLYKENFSSYKEKESEYKENVIQKFDWDLSNYIREKYIFKLFKNFSYILGTSLDDIEKQFLQNYSIIYLNDNIQYDVKNKKLLVKNIESLINARIYFLKTYFKIFPGFFKFRDNLYISIRIYLKFNKIKDKYMLDTIFKIVR